MDLDELIKNASSGLDPNLESILKNNNAGKSGSEQDVSSFIASLNLGTAGSPAASSIDVNALLADVNRLSASSSAPVEGSAPSTLPMDMDIELRKLMDERDKKRQESKKDVSKEAQKAQVKAAVAHALLVEKQVLAKKAAEDESALKLAEELERRRKEDEDITRQEAELISKLQAEFAKEQQQREEQERQLRQTQEMQARLERERILRETAERERRLVEEQERMRVLEIEQSELAEKTELENLERELLALREERARAQQELEDSQQREKDEQQTRIQKHMAELDRIKDLARQRAAEQMELQREQLALQRRLRDEVAAKEREDRVKQQLARLRQTKKLGQHLAQNLNAEGLLPPRRQIDAEQLKAVALAERERLQAVEAQQKAKEEERKRLEADREAAELRAKEETAAKLLQERKAAEVKVRSLMEQEVQESARKQLQEKEVLESRMREERERLQAEEELARMYRKRREQEKLEMEVLFQKEKEELQALLLRLCPEKAEMPCMQCNEPKMPRLFRGCFHTVCKHNFEQVKEDENGNMECPLCHVPHSKDRVVSNFVSEKYTLHKLLERSIPCANCQSNVADVFCTDPLCSRYLCQTCDEKIHKNRLFSSHVRITDRKRFLYQNPPYTIAKDAKFHVLTDNDCPDHGLSYMFWAPDDKLPLCPSCLPIYRERSHAPIIKRVDVIARIRQTQKQIAELVDVASRSLGLTSGLNSNIFRQAREHIHQIMSNSKKQLEEQMDALRVSLLEQQQVLQKKATLVNSKHMKLLFAQRQFLDVQETLVSKAQSKMRAQQGQKLGFSDVITSIHGLEEAMNPVFNVEPISFGKIELDLDIDRTKALIRKAIDLSFHREDHRTRQDAITVEKKKSDGTWSIFRFTDEIGPNDMSYFFSVKLLRIGDRQTLRIGLIDARRLKEGGDYTLGGRSEVSPSWAFECRKGTLRFYHNNEHHEVQLETGTSREEDPVHSDWAKNTILGVYVDRIAGRITLSIDNTFYTASLPLKTSLHQVLVPAIAMEQRGDAIQILSATYVVDSKALPIISSTILS